MEKLRTPDERFTSLPGYPWAPHYLDVDDFEGGTLRLHYLDEGPRDARPVLLFHGEPTWSYLYRKMIPPLVAAGHRVLAPDLAGMGRSDKPTQRSDYSVERHAGWMRAWVSGLDIRDATWFGQDWGSFIGLLAVTYEPERFRAIVLANGVLPNPGRMERLFEFAVKSPDIQAFPRWQAWIATQSRLEASRVVVEIPGAGIKLRCALSLGELAAYDAPFPDERYQAGALVFPFLGNDLSPEAVRMCRRGWEVLEAWKKPLVTAYGKADTVIGWMDDVFHKWVPGAAGQPHRVFPDGTHFIQEEEPAALAEVIDEVARRA